MASLSKVFFASTVATVAACGGAGCSHADHVEHIVTPEATASHILVKTKEAAEELLTKFTDDMAEEKVKELFAELAKEHSECPSKENGGSLGSFEMGQMVPEFENVIFDTEKAVGKVHGPIETQFGQHLILIDNRLNGDGSKDGNVPVVKKATASHILVDEEEKIMEFKAQIEAAEDQLAEFGKVAAEHSKCPSGAQAQGSLGNFRQGQMVPEFDQVIFGAEYELNKVHGPVKTQFGHHLIFITERSGMEGEESTEEKKEECKSCDDAASDASTEAPSDSEEPSKDLEEEKKEEVEEEKKEEECESKNAEL